MVKIPAAGVVRPIEEPLIGVLVIVPPLIVRPSTTIASVIELFGRFTAPLTFKLVDVTLLIVVLPKLVMPLTYKLVEVTPVPLALVKDKLATVPIAVRFGKEVEAVIVKYVLEASA